MEENQGVTSLEEANKIRTSFLANMSHELRTPLNAIIGFSEMLKQRTFGSLGNDRNGEYIAEIHSAGMHMLKLVQNLLDLSNIEAGGAELDEEIVSPSALLESMRLMVEPSCVEKGVRIEIAVPRALPDIYADSAKIKQMMLHLCRNSLTHTPADGQILLKAEMSNGSVVFEITDSGCGIKPDEMDRLVGNFGHAQSDAVVAKPGAGVGLPLSHALLALHGGELQVMSTVGVGTTVRAIFPADRTLVDTPVAALTATG